MDRGASPCSIWVTGHHNNLKVTYQTKDKVETVFDGDLIAALLLKAVAGGVNMNCENDFTIKFVIKDYCGGVLDTL